MRALPTTGLIALLILFLVGCSSSDNKSIEAATAGYGSTGSSFYGNYPQRQIIKTARLSLEAKQPEVLAEQVRAIVVREKGIIDSSSSYSGNSISIDTKVPQEKLELVMDELGRAGKLVSKSINTKDVTDEMIDVEARLNNLIALREKYRVLLAKAMGVKDTLAVESELNRIQTEIDSLQGRMNSLKSQVAYSSLAIHIGKQKQYGPLGYVTHGLYLGLKLLFVID